jgi:4-hydroxy-tetrahydrodipicolinate reductase
MTTRIAIYGAAGRMGRRLVALAHDDPALSIAAALDSASHADVGKDAGLLAGIGEIGVPLASSLSGDVDAVIDFSVPEVTDEVLKLCTSRKIALVMATTGHSDAQKERLRAAAKIIPLVRAPSMSLAVNLTMKLAADAARALKGNSAGVDVEILERHHRFKEDAPSGTALKFGEILAREMGITHTTHGRQGRPGARPRNEIGYHAIRTGDNPGEHTIVFGMLGETIELTVRASSRDCYAIGALAAAKFVAGKPAGLYTMNDVLGL